MKKRLFGIFMLVTAPLFAQSPVPALAAGNDKAFIQLSGQISPIAMFLHDSNTGHFFVGTNSQQNHRLRLIGFVQPNEFFRAGAKLELGFDVNGSDALRQNYYMDPLKLDLRHADVSLSSKYLGQISLGKGDTASEESSEMDLSQTLVASRSSLARIGGAMSFASLDGSAAPTIGDVFENLDGLSRKNRMRYDSPRLFGFWLAGSYSELNTVDGSLNYRNDFESLSLAAKVGYAHENSTNSTFTQTKTSGRQLSGSASVLFDFGLSLTVANGFLFTSDATRQNPYFIYGKIGYFISKLANSHYAFFLEYSHNAHFAINESLGHALGGGVVHHWKALQTEIFLAYRAHLLSIAEQPYKPLHLIYSGLRFVF